MLEVEENYRKPMEILPRTDEELKAPRRDLNLCFVLLLPSTRDPSITMADCDLYLGTKDRIDVAS
jgi:hypothetical protein